jgi:tetratricopeptide (TPR) repeat protein
VVRRKPAGQTDPADYLILIGEPPIVRLNVKVANTSDAAHNLVSPERTISVMIETFPDRQRVEIPTPTVPSPARVFGSSEALVSWDERLLLAADEHLKWMVDLNLDSLPPGIYFISVVVSGTDENGNRVQPVAPGVYIEVRDSADANAAKEIALREVIRLSMNERRDEAIQAALRTIARYPDSALAHSWLGRLYTQSGRTSDAIKIYAQSLAILERNGDSTFIPLKPEQRQQSLRWLREEIGRLQKR